MSQFIDLTGQTSGCLKAIEYLGNSKWLCKCTVCGNEVVIMAYWFRKNIRLGRDGCKHPAKINIGDTFGNLTIIGRGEDYIHPKSGSHETTWECRCACGRTKTILQSNLISFKSTSCGQCSNSVSIPEKAIVYYLSPHYSDLIENYRPDCLNGKEVDVYLPSIRVGIEYDGERWHKNLQEDIEKDKVLKDNNIGLIRIREPGCPLYDGPAKLIVTPRPTTNGTHMTEPIVQLISILGDCYGLNTHIDVDCLRDNAEICKTMIKHSHDASLASLYPDLAKEWDYEKNAPLTPDRVAAHSGRKTWWICEKGHSFSAVIASRTAETRPTGCPICSNKGSGLYVDGKYIGEDSLQKKAPDVAKDFDAAKNGFTADEIAVASNKKVWWKCSKCGYSWQSKVNNRTSSLHTGCPNCAKKNNTQGKNKTKNTIERNGSLLDNYPELCKEWDYDKNTVLPTQFHKNSRDKVWWICPKGHSYQAAISHRTSNKPTGCPYCMRKAVLNVETGERFSSIGEAARAYGVVDSSIAICCKDFRKTAKGCHWRFADE